MPNIPQVKIGNTTYDIKDSGAREQIDELNSALSQEQTFSDGQATILFPSLKKQQIIKNAVTVLTGTYVAGKAWRKTGIESSNASYCYARYENSEIVNNPGSALFVSGWSWTDVYPLICFYDSSNKLLASYGNELTSTDHKYNIVTIPYTTAYAIVNGKPSTEVPEVAYISNENLNRLLSNDVSAFGVTVTASWLSDNSGYSSIRAWPNNVIYNIGSDVSDIITDVPDGFLTWGTLIKFQGTNHPTTNGYTSYLLINDDGVWIGWDDNNSIYWQKINNLDSFNINCGLTIVEPSSTVTGKVKHVNGNEASNGNYLYSVYSITGGQTYIVSGWHYANTATSGYPVYLLYDENDAVISFGNFGSTGHAIKHYKLTVPNNAVKMIINGATDPTGYMKPLLEQVDNSFALNSIYQKVKPRKYLFIGDSYCEGYSHDGRNSGWATYCAEYMGLEETDYVSKYYGGARFSANASNNTFLALLNTTDYPFDYFTDIVVCGGYNDHTYTDEQIMTGIQTFVARAKLLYPQAKVHIGCVAYNKAGNGDGAEENWEAYRAQITGNVIPAYQKCVEYDAEYLNNVEYWLGESGLTPSDGYHPSETGNRSIARAVKNALLTGSAPLPYNADLRNN